MKDTESAKARLSISQTRRCKAADGSSAVAWLYCVLISLVNTGKIVTAALRGFHRMIPLYYFTWPMVLTLVLWQRLFNVAPPADRQPPAIGGAAGLS